MPLTLAARVLAPIVKATVAPASLVPVMVLPTSAALMMLSVATVLMTGAATVESSTHCTGFTAAALTLAALSVWRTWIALIA